MKKVMIAAAIVACAMISNAASVTWKYTGAAEDVGSTVYLFTASVSNQYDSFADLIKGAVSSATVASKKVGPKTTYVTPDTVAAADSITKTGSLYAVLVSGDSATTYKYGTLDAASLVYDPNNQETSPGTFAMTTASFTSSGTIGGTSPIPEPTSGLLMILGMAGLALRRRRA